MDLSLACVMCYVSDEDDDDDDDVAAAGETQPAMAEHPATVLQALATYGPRTFQDRQGFVGVSQKEEHAVLNSEWAEMRS